MKNGKWKMARFSQRSYYTTPDRLAACRTKSPFQVRERCPAEFRPTAKCLFRQTADCICSSVICLCMFCGFTLQLSDFGGKTDVSRKVAKHAKNTTDLKTLMASLLAARCNAPNPIPPALRACRPASGR